MNETTQKDHPQQPSPVPPSSPPYPPYPYYYPPPPYEDEDEINLLDLWRILWSQKLLIVLFTIMCTVAVIGYALGQTPIYRSEVLLASVSKEQTGNLSRIAGQFGGIAALAGLDITGGSGSKQEAIALLKSRALTEEFIRDEELLRVLFDDKWNNATQHWEVDDPKAIPTMWDAYKKFNGLRNVSEDKATGLVTLAIEWKDPELAAEWAGKLVDRVNERMRERAIRDTEKSLEYLNREIAKTSSVEVQEAIYRLMESQIKQIMLANVREEYSFKIIDPPTVPDLGARVRPKRKLMVIIGFSVGLFGGVFLAFFINFVENAKKRDRQKHHPDD